MVKQQINTFYQYHPTANMVYFLAVILFGVFFMHPLLLATAFGGAFTYALVLLGHRIKTTLLFGLPMFALVCIINPLFNHRGMTVLWYLDDNPITLESIVYGVVSATMLLTILLWFACYNQVVSSDKFIYLFGKAIPHVALLISMALRFVPLFIRQAKQISHAQTLIGKGLSQKGLRSKIKNGLRIMSILITWALENSIETADSMKARGYGLKGRTSFSLYRFEKRDGMLLGLLAVCITGILILAGLGYTHHQYFPYMDFAGYSPPFLLLTVLYGILCFIPTLLELAEALKWRVLQSKI